MDREAWRAAVHGFPKSQTRLSDSTGTGNINFTVFFLLLLFFFYFSYVARRILVPPPGIRMEPASPALPGGFLTIGPLGKSLWIFLS